MAKIKKTKKHTIKSTRKQNAMKKMLMLNKDYFFKGYKSWNNELDKWWDYKWWQ